VGEAVYIAIFVPAGINGFYFTLGTGSGVSLFISFVQILRSRDSSTALNPCLLWCDHTQL